MDADYQDFKHKEQTIIKVFYRVYNKLGYGFFEKIYENAMMIEFRIEIGLLLNFVTKPELKRKVFDNLRKETSAGIGENLRPN